MITNALKKLLESRGLSSAGIKDIADAIERLTDDSYIRETLAKLIANLADAYSEDDTYPVGDYVFYEDVLYKCVEPVTVGEPFDPNKWVKTTIEEMFINADVSSAVAALANDIAPMYDPTHAYKLGDYVIYQFGLYQKASGSTVAENWNPSHWNPVNIAEIINRLREELSNDILNVKITYDPTTERATSDVAGTVINNAITNGKTVAAYVNNVPAAVTKTGTGNSYILSFEAQRVSSYGTDEVVLEDILVRYINVTGQWTATVTSKTIPLNGGDSDFYTVTMSYDSENEVWTCDKTYSELQKFESSYSGSDHEDAPLIKIIVDSDTEDDWKMSYFGNLMFSSGDDPMLTAFSYNGGDGGGIHYQKFVINSDESVEYSTGYSDESSVDSGIFVVPLTFVPGGEEDVTAKENYKGVWDANTTYDADDIVKVTVYDENSDVNGYERYVGVYDSTTSYNEGDIVYYMEDITQKTEYKGTWDSSVTYNSGDIVSYDNQYWCCSTETSLNDVPDNYNDWYNTSPYSEYFKSKVSSNSGNDPRSDYEGSGDYWDVFYWNEYEPNYNGGNRLKGEWSSSSTYGYGDIIWKLDGNNKKIYYVTEYENDIENVDPENGSPWDKIGPDSSDEYFFSIGSSNRGNDPRNGASYWEIYEPVVYYDKYTSDVTLQEIKSAFSEHKLVIGVVDGGVETSDEYFGKLFILTQVDVNEITGEEATNDMVISVTFAHDTFDSDKMYLYESLTPYSDQGSNPISLIRMSDSEFREPSTLVIELNSETEDPTDKYNYHGEWDPTSNYDDGDIVHYSEDVTQKSNYYGEYDSSITSYDNIGYSEPIVYTPEDGLYYYVEWDGESSWLGDEYVPESGYFLVDATEETPKLGERYNVRSYYSTGVTKNQIREALKAGKSVIAVRYGDYDAGGFFSDEIYTLVNNSVVAEGEMTSRTSLTRFVGIEKQSGKTVFLESNLMDGNEELHLYQEEYDSDDDEEGGIVVIPLTFIGEEEEDVTAKENYKGEWDPSSTYDYDDIVHVSEDNGYYYVETTQVIDPETGEQVTTYTLGNEYSPEIIPQHYHMDYHPEQIIEDVKNGKVVVARHCYNDYETQVDTFILNHARTVTGGGEGDYDLLADIEFYAFEDSVSFIKLSYVGHYGSNWESDNDDYEGVDLDIYITHIAETSYTVTYSDSIAQTFDNYEDYAVGDLVVNYINDGNQYKLFRCTRAVTGDGTGFNENYWTEVQFNDAFVLKSDIAPFYDPNETYSSGDVVFFNNRLYKCNTTISTAEPFDNNKWDHTTLIDIEDDEDEPALKNIKDAENGGIIEGIVDHNIASGKYSHAEGGVSEYDDIYDEYTYEYTTASGEGSHAEGSKTTASGKGSHAEGEITKATNKYSHSEGRLTTAGGMYSHAEGDSSNAQGSCSHAEGVGTLAYSAYQHVLGSYNVGDPSGPSSYGYRGTYVEIVGNGLVESSRSNARTLDWSGNESLAGGLTLGKGTADEVTITAAQLKALLALLNT